jgi:SNF2 family DNA or RNA helicase
MWDSFDFRLILNGTPVSKNLVDLYSQMRFVHPKIFDMTERDFAEKYLFFKDDGSIRPWHKWSRPANEAALVEIIRPYIFDADLDIPVSMYTDDKHYGLNEHEAEEYEEIKSEFLSLEYDDINFLALSQKLQANYSKADSKLKGVQEIISSNNSQFIIYTKFIDNLETLKHLFPHALEYSGRHKDDITQFTSGSSRLLIMTYGTGTMGLNLQNCNYIIFFDQTFDQKDKLQAVHRVYRTGQTKNVIVYDMWVDTGLERIIKRSTQKKQATINNIKNFIQAVGVKAL